ncbi:MAG: PAS domain S-box protein [Desulfobulbia bacterium]
MILCILNALPAMEGVQRGFPKGKALPMRDFLEQLTGATEFMPHGYCLVWDPALLWLHAGSDVVTGLAYLLIAAMLFYLVAKRRDLPFFGLFLLFGAFILACGLTHFFAAWTIYVPSYWEEGLVKAVTALISIITALLLLPLLPKLLILPNLSRSLEENKRLNRELEHQIETLRKSEERFRSLVNASYDAIVIADAQGNILSVNGATEKMFGYGEKELEGKPLTILMPERYRESHRLGLKNFVVSDLGPHTGKAFDFAGRRKNGSEFPLELNVSIWVSEGEVNFGAVIRDVTERTRLETETFNAQQRFKTLVDSLDALVYVADFETHELLFVNRYGREIWGEIAGQICWQALQTGQTGPCAFCTNDRLLDKEGRPTGVHVWEFQNTANNQWYECRDQAIEWTDGRYVRMEVATNITARKRADQEKAELETQIRTTQKMEAIGTLAGGIAHDFNNILVPIIAYTDMVMATEVPGSGNWQNLQEVYKAANRAKELVKQILTFSREREHEICPVQIVPVVKESLKLLKASLPSTIEITQRLEAEGITILADPTQIHQIVMNLCTNAYHAMRDKGGVMEVTLSQVAIGSRDSLDRRLLPGSYLVLTVSDTGLGMDQATMERIFDPYFTTRKHGEGTGLGLAVVLGIVKKYGGDIRVYSEPGQGASFQVYFPVLGKVEEGLSSILSTAPVTGDERLLLVDDEPQIVDSMQKMLEFHGYHVTTKTSSVEALEVFRLGPESFDLVITDQTMPYMTGDQLVLELKKIRPDIPVVLCTGFSLVLDEAKAKALGIDAFLLKPVLRKEMSETIRRVLDTGKNGQ